MVHRYIAETLVTLSRPAVGRYLDRRVPDRPMRRLYNDRNSIATRSLYRSICRPTVDRGVDRYIGVDTPYKTQGTDFPSFPRDSSGLNIKTDIVQPKYQRFTHRFLYYGLFSLTGTVASKVPFRQGFRVWFSGRDTSLNRIVSAPALLPTPPCDAENNCKMAGSK